MMKWLLLASALLLGCSPAESQNNNMPEAVQVHDRCHLCGMVIHKHPGPKGELLMSDGMVPKFCATRDMFSFALQPENQRRIKAMYVHDAGRTDWEHPEDSAFMDATKAWYVYGSRRKGAMGPSLAPFSSREAAEAFAASWGGRVLAYEDVTLSLLEGAH
ncbi:nitrous oxide reductase accessory protein NosL [Shewanella sp. YIC-542]|uniref:nitrous oxide reductase accessory protein NosL n=1 Tax=Shewanella mytili TaxID=3377111 RepID=UPI00398E41C7